MGRPRKKKVALVRGHSSAKGKVPDLKGREKGPTVKGSGAPERWSAKEEAEKREKVRWGLAESATITGLNKHKTRVKIKHKVRAKKKKSQSSKKKRPTPKHLQGGAGKKTAETAVRFFSSEEKKPTWKKCD